METQVERFDKSRADTRLAIPWDEPDTMMAVATKWASVLSKVIKAQHMASNINGKEYVEVDGWELALTLAHISPMPRSAVTAVRDDDGNIVAYEAIIDLIDEEGRKCGGGYATCSMDSFPTRGRKGYDRDRAAQSTAQTWALSKAARLKLGFVIRLAGYEATPAHEILGQTGEDGSPKDERLITEPQQRRLYAIMREAGLSDDAVKAYMAENFQIDTSAALNREQYDQLCEWIQAK